jgi:hypothetical protein
MLKAVLIILLFPLFVSAQSGADKTIDELKDSLSVLAKRMAKGDNDSVRNASAMVFQQLVEGILNDPTSAHADFDSIKNISVKTAPDKSFRLYTWTYPSNDAGKYYYYGYLQTYSNEEFKRFKGVAPKIKVSLFKLCDSTDVIEKPQSVKLNPQRWYGAVYYSILKNVKDKKNYYTLLGWHGKDAKITRKLADVLYFDEGKPVFGYPLFKAGKVYHNRLLFQYDAQAVMTLHYDEDRRLIVFDHIANRGGLMGPDGTYDAYKFGKTGHWELVEDVDVNAGFKPKPAPKPVPDEQLEEKDKEMKGKK